MYRPRKLLSVIKNASTIVYSLDTAFIFRPRDTYNYVVLHPLQPMNAASINFLTWSFYKVSLFSYSLILLVSHPVFVIPLPFDRDGDWHQLELINVYLFVMFGFTKLFSIDYLHP